MRRRRTEIEAEMISGVNKWRKHRRAWKTVTPTTVIIAGPTGVGSRGANGGYYFRNPLGGGLRLPVFAYVYAHKRTGTHKEATAHDRSRATTSKCVACTPTQSAVCESASGMSSTPRRAATTAPRHAHADPKNNVSREIFSPSHKFRCLQTMDPGGVPSARIRPRTHAHCTLTHVCRNSLPTPSVFRA